MFGRIIGFLLLVGLLAVVGTTIYNAGVTAGIAAEVGDAIASAAVFDRFYRSPDSPGTGLGLPIARDLVEAHGGEMTATSEVGLGTTVRFTLPVVSPTAPG